LVVSFSLPKGAFATTVLREIMKNENSQTQMTHAELEHDRKLRFANCHQ
jgi:tRNA(Glu) U13 pseudouridine synthase TruD